MKKFGLVFLGAFLCSMGLAQSNIEEVDLMQSLFGMEKKAIITEFIQLDMATHDAFWTLYDQYEAERKALGKDRIGLIEQYAEHYYDMTDEQAAQFMAQLFDQRKKTDKLLESYYKKITKATSPIVGMQFYQVESYILTAIRLYILDEVPFIRK